MINLRPYQTGDFEGIADRLRDNGYERPKQELAIRVLALVMDGTLAGEAVSVVDDDGSVVAVAVAYECAPGVAEVCLMETSGIEKHGRRFYELSNEFLDGLPFRRVQAYCAVPFTRSYKYLKNTGFTCEGVLRAFAPDGTDVFLMGRVK